VHEFCFLFYRPPHFKINYCTLFSSASGKGKPVEKLKIDRKDDEEDEESEYVKLLCRWCKYPLSNSLICRLNVQEISCNCIS
jgi:hypothetical protein